MTALTMLSVTHLVQALKRPSLGKRSFVPVACWARTGVSLYLSAWMAGPEGKGA